MELLDSETEILLEQPEIPEPTATRLILRAAVIRDGESLVRAAATSQFRGCNARHYTVLADAALMAKLDAETRALNDVRGRLAKKREAGERWCIGSKDERATVVPWTVGHRAAVVVLALIGVLSVAIVWNSCASFIISSGVVSRFVQYPEMGYLFSFGAAAIAIALEGLIANMTSKSRRRLLWVVGLAAIAAFAVWLNEIGGLVSSGTLSLAQLKSQLLSPGDPALSKRLLLTQAATELLAGILAWIAAGCICEKHRLVGLKDDGEFKLLEAEARKLDEVVTPLTRRLHLIQTKRELLDAAEKKYIEGEIARVQELVAEAQFQVRCRDERHLITEWLLQEKKDLSPSTDLGGDNCAGKSNGANGHGPSSSRFSFHPDNNK